MIFLANRANLDKRTLLNRIHTYFQTQVARANTPVKQVWYHPSSANKKAVRATVDADSFLDTPYPADDVELHIRFDFPPNRGYDWYKIQWVEPGRELMVGWHQDETHMDLGPCHFQIDYEGETVGRAAACFLDTHPLNVFDQRIDHLLDILQSITWENGTPSVPSERVR